MNAKPQSLRAHSWSFARGKPLACALATILSSANVLLMLAFFLLALGLSADNTLVLGAGAGGALLALRVLGFGRGLLRYVDLLLGHKLMFDFVTRARLLMFAGLAQQGARMLPAGQALQLMLNLLQRLDGVYLRLVAPAATMGLALLCLAILLTLYAHWLYAVLALLSVGVPLLLAPLYVERANIGKQLRADKLQRFRKLLLVDFFAALPDWLSLDSERKLLSAEDAYQQRAQQHNQEQLQAQAQAQFAYLLAQALGLLAALLFASSRPAVGAGDYAALLALLVLQRLGAMSLPSLLELAQLSSGWRACSRLSGIGAVEPQSSSATAITERADLVFDRIRLHYPNAPTATLDELSLRIVAGEKLLLRGPSGGGKSTLLYALGGLLPLTGGSIRYGNYELGSTESESWRSIFACSTQARQIVNCSLREQLFSARPDAELRAVLARVGLEPWLEALPQGLNTRLGEAAWQPSGGQYQLLQVARVLLSAAPVWVFDEVSNGLDPERRELVARLIDTCVGDRTLIYISHDDDYLPRYDRQVLLEAGRVA